MNKDNSEKTDNDIEFFRIKQMVCELKFKEPPEY